MPAPQSINSILFTSPRYRVVAVRKKTKARFMHGIVEGDVVHYEMNFSATGGASRGHYSLGISVYVNGQLKGMASQGELPRMFETHYILQEISPE